jgi:serine/threonine-protein kinase PknG
MNCQQPGCTGQILDGYCDVCWMAPARTSPVPAPSASGAPAALAPSGPAAAAPAPSGPAALGSAPAAGASASAPTVAASALARRSGTTRTRPSGRSRLGAGIVAIPAVPYRDPADAVMADPSVPESRRYCGRCDEPVGRGRDGEPGRTSGFCRKCGAAFSFDPKLAPGELVSGQYEVVGCLAHGGMGWVYLARDRNVSDRWVVLKGLLNAGDRDATAAALAERRFLAEVEHPNIVKIFNFVEHDGSGYIVMEYVGGSSLKQILAERRAANGGEPDPVPAAEAIAYMLESLPALGHLHDTGLLFCDFKLDNVIQTQHSLKLIDLGGVYRIDEPSSAIFGTVGYQAPEIATAGPSIPSDLFTVARTLAVLCIDFRGYQSTYRFTLPAEDAVPLFARHDSLYRFLLKGTAQDPESRFQSAEEMADQLHGVLREVVAEEQNRPLPAPSTLFTSPLRSGPERPDWHILPRPQASTGDASAGYLAAITATDPAQMLTQLRAAPERTPEVELRIAAAMIEAGDAEAQTVLRAVEEGDPWEWRVAWYRGIAALAAGGPGRARESFAAVYRDVPGELAPKLGLGLACEIDGDVAQAARWYRIVARTDPSITSASFGLARCLLLAGDRDGAIAAYERVPDTSSGYIDAQVARIGCLSAGNGSGEPTIQELIGAGTVLESLALDAEQRNRLSAEVLEAALRLTLVGKIGGDRGATVLGRRLVERDLRLGLEQSYRALARRAPTRAERIRLVDEANRTRPRTWT